MHCLRGFPAKGSPMFSKDPYFDQHVFPAVTAFREAKSRLIALEERYGTSPSEEIVSLIRSAQQQVEAARAALRNATRATPPLWSY